MHRFARLHRSLPRRAYSSKPSTENGISAFTSFLLVGSLVAIGPAFSLVKPLLHAPQQEQPPAAEIVQPPAQKTNSAPKPLPGVPFVEYVLIGGGTAAYSAMMAIREKEPNAHILIISEDNHLPYARPPLSKEMWFNPPAKDLTYTDWQDQKQSIFYMPADRLEESIAAAAKTTKIPCLLGTTVKQIDTDTHTIRLPKGAVQYGKVLIATGGSPKKYFNSNKDSHFLNPFPKKHLQDYLNLEKVVAKKEKIVVVGGGFLGSELSVALAQRGKNKDTEIIQIFPEDGNMGMIMPHYLSKWTTGQLVKEGVTVKPQSVIKKVSGTGSKVSIELENNEVIDADHVIIAAGIAPNTTLAKSSSLELDSKLGGIVVNAELEARSDVFAAGDVTSYHDIALGRRRVEHYDHALESGRTAGLNMTGAKVHFSFTQTPYKHQSMFWSNLGPKISYEAVGVVDSKLPTVSVWSKDAGPSDGDKHERGVVYYMKEKKVVGVLLWNIPNKVETAREIILAQRTVTDPNKLSNVINIHEE